MIYENFLPDKMPRHLRPSNDNLKVKSAIMAAAEMFHDLNRIPDRQAVIIIALVSQEFEKRLNRMKEDHNEPA